jgi:soluble lytic murein transglycosylase-like protein
MKNRIALAALAAALLAGAAVRAAADTPQTGVAPHVLGAEDIRLYREIFADEDAGQFAAATKKTAELTDRSLIGYVEAERLLSPAARHIKLAQLQEWLAAYDDLPVAGRIRALAEKKNRRHKVEIAALPPVHHRGGGYEESDQTDPSMSSDAGHAAQQQIDAAIHASQPAQAEAILNGLATGGIAPSSDVARLSQRVEASYLAEGQDDAVLKVGAGVTADARLTAPMLDWDEGLAAYRLGKYADAATHFETLAQVGSVAGPTRSAAAFWAARAHTQAGDPLRVVTLLTAATREQPTFYGMLAQKMLGQDDQTAFSEPVLDHDSLASLMQVPAAHRAVALWQIGRNETLSDEMDRALSSIDLGAGPAYAALARRLDLPNLELRACETAASRGVMLTGLFPVPRYAPEGGYHVDPSLVLAFARAESRFRADAVSGAGARGLMQLMPGTAAHVDGATPSEKQLSDPAYNLGLGQRYLTELLGQLDGNIVELAAAYNAGPGSLNRWMGTRGSAMSDPLLFIESMPAPETRNYVKRVLTYYWMYAKRTGETAPTLDEAASGKWPRYHDAAKLSDDTRHGDGAADN